MIYIPCQAEVDKIIASQVVTYEHKGKHLHPRPPNGKAHPIQTQLLHQTIQNNPNTLPHSLRIGSTLSSDNPSISNLISGNIIPSGIHHSASSIGNIAPQFNNLSRVSKIRKEVLSAHPNLITTIKGSDTFIMDYAQLQKDCPDFIQQFIIESEVMIITLQIPFMKKVLSIYQDDLRDLSSDDDFSSTEFQSSFNNESPFLGGGIWISMMKRRMMMRRMMRRMMEMISSPLLV
jgi:hypothetical protein